ncbi:Polymer-forming protein [Lachnospiraceae bacterium XBB2008]|nr:Polymer-forming protein [Lachnospiraceae bacterium XBB2008]
MGFFSDLKDDLSQAVNEMMPEEEGMASESTDSLADVDLSAMLDKMDTGVLDGGDYEAEPEPEPAPEPEPEPVPAPAPEPEPAPVVIPEPASKPEPAPSTSHAAAAVQEYLSNDTTPKDRKQVLDETAVITAGMEINGDVNTQGSLELVGRIIGNVNALGKLSVTGTIKGNAKAAEVYAEGAQMNGDVISDGAVKVGQSTVIIGNITATSAVIAGAVKGDIDVRGPVILDGSAIVMGNIKSKYVQINNGAVIEGMCSQAYADVNPTSFFEELKKSF